MVKILALSAVSPAALAVVLAVLSFGAIPTNEARLIGARPIAWRVTVGDVPLASGWRGDLRGAAERSVVRVEAIMRLRAGPPES